MSHFTLYSSLRERLALNLFTQTTYSIFTLIAAHQHSLFSLSSSLDSSVKVLDVCHGSVSSAKCCVSAR